MCLPVNSVIEQRKRSRYAMVYQRESMLIIEQRCLRKYKVIVLESRSRLMCEIIEVANWFSVNKECEMSLRSTTLDEFGQDTINVYGHSWRMSRLSLKAAYHRR